MRKLRLAIVLPLLLCGTEAMLWYWHLHSLGFISSYFVRVTHAIQISDGLDFPATIASLFLKYHGTLGWLFFLVCVAGCWHSIGTWLDDRASGDEDEELKLEAFLSWRRISQLVLLVFGLFALVFAHKFRVYDFVDVLERALIQTWAVFLLAVPLLGIARRRLGQFAHERSTQLGSQARRPLGNFGFFLTVLGTFAVLLTLGILAGPYVPRENPGGKPGTENRENRGKPGKTGDAHHVFRKPGTLTMFPGFAATPHPPPERFAPWADTIPENVVSVPGFP